MTGRLSSTLFQGDGSTQVLVQDAYGVASQESHNSMYDSVKGIYADAVDGLYTNKNSPKQLAQIIMAAKKGNIDRQDMIDRALGAMGTSLPNLLGQLGGSLKNVIGDAAGTLIGPNAKKNIDVLFNGIPSIVNVVDVKDASSLFEFIAEMTGNSELASIINIEAESAIISGIASALMSYGIPDLVDYVIEDSRNEQVRRNAWAYISTDAVYGSDLAGINKVIDKIGVAAFLERNPDAINMILTQFFFGTNDTPPTYPAKRIELINTLVRINPNWDKYNRNGVLIPNLEPFQVSSADAKKLWFLEEPQRSYCLTAISYPPKTPYDVMTLMYPGALFTQAS